MAKQRKRKRIKRTRHQDYPGWVWMLFGLSIGLSVALAIFMKDRESGTAVQEVAPEPASMALMLVGVLAIGLARRRRFV